MSATAEITLTNMTMALIALSMLKMLLLALVTTISQQPPPYSKSPEAEFSTQR